MILYRRSALNEDLGFSRLPAEWVLLFPNCLYLLALVSPKRGRDIFTPGSSSKTESLDDNLLDNPIPDPGTISSENSDGLKLFGSNAGGVEFLSLELASIVGQVDMGSKRYGFWPLPVDKTFLPCPIKSISTFCFAGTFLIHTANKFGIVSNNEYTIMVWP